VDEHGLGASSGLNDAHGADAMRYRTILRLTMWIRPERPEGVTAERWAAFTVAERLYPPLHEIRPMWESRLGNSPWINIDVMKPTGRTR
jgi:hypothetical protein